MKTATLSRNSGVRISRRFRAIALAALFGCLFTASTSEAHPTIYITFCGSASGGQAPFYLYWGSEGTKNASNYIWTYLYDVNGHVLSGYPIEDPTDYVIPPGQIGPPPAPCISATSAEPDIASGAVTVSLSDSGQWNPASTGTEACGSMWCMAASAARKTSLKASGQTLAISAPVKMATPVNAQLTFASNPIVVENTGTTEQMTLTASNGTLNVTPEATLTITNPNTATLGLNASLGTLNHALTSLVYTPNANYNGWDTLNISDVDSGTGQTATTKVPIAVFIPVTNPTNPSLKVTVHGKRLSHGETSKYDVWIEVHNPKATIGKVRFAYSLFAKTDADNGNIIPIKQSDAEGTRRLVNMVTHAGAHVETDKTKTADHSRSDFHDYAPPANTKPEQPYMVKDLQVDLSKGVAPGDSVYLDVWVIDQANHEHYPLPRTKILP
jgi:hypothetical protein